MRGSPCAASEIRRLVDGVRWPTAGRILGTAGLATLVAGQVFRVFDRRDVPELLNERFKIPGLMQGHVRSLLRSWSLDSQAIIASQHT